MTKEEAIVLNDWLLLAAESYTGNKENEWQWLEKSCSICGDEFEAGDKFINFIPESYKHRAYKADFNKMHYNCLLWQDRGRYSPGIIYIASSENHKPLLSSDEIYDIITSMQKETV